jgi:TBCC domain-containing protein 1
VLAPYNTFYEHLGEHLIEARLRPEACTAWDRPVVLGVDVTIQDGSSSPSAPDVVRISSGITLMPPDAFTLFIVPFREYVADVVADAPPTPSSVAATTQANPFDVPANYVTALESKMQLICDVRARVRDSSLPETKRGELQAAIQSHFKAWLQQSGKSREIFDLSAIEREEMRAAGGEMRAAGATAATA